MASLVHVTIRVLRPGETYRYPKAVDANAPLIDGITNFRALSIPPGSTLPTIGMERGIDGPAIINAPAGSRKPAIFLRTSAYKAGSSESPWHDVYDLRNGKVRYFGDHTAQHSGPVGSTTGNRTLEKAFPLHTSDSPDDRQLAPPMLLFRAAKKGYLEFAGIAVMTTLDLVEESDPDTGVGFKNYVSDLIVLDSGILDFRWIDDRRDVSRNPEQCLRYAPTSWRLWVDHGHIALDDIRRTD